MGCMSDAPLLPVPLAQQDRRAVPPTPGEVITSLATNNTYTIGEKIGEGNFGVVYSCEDVWGNQLV